MVSWTGMRGVVTLNAAAGIPWTTETGEPFPQRALIQAIAFSAWSAPLLLQGSTLPPLIRRLQLPSHEDDDRVEAAKAAMIVHDAADQVLPTSGPTRLRGSIRGCWPRSVRPSHGTPRTPTRCRTRRHTRCRPRCSPTCTGKCSLRSARR